MDVQRAMRLIPVKYRLLAWCVLTALQWTLRLILWLVRIPGWLVGLSPRGRAIAAGVAAVYLVSLPFVQFAPA